MGGLESTSTSPIVRPPTPPRESNKDEKTGLVGRFLKSSTIRRSSAPPSTTTPNSSAESPTGTSRRTVVFSEWPQYNEPQTPSFDGGGTLRRSIRSLLPSSERKPPKSILKAHNATREQDSPSINNTGALRPPHTYSNFTTMLESMINHLKGGDRSCKVDAYNMLCNCLKACENVPDLKALKERTSLLCQYIERDLSQKLDNGRPDSTLVINAIQLFHGFLHKYTVAETIPTDFTIRFVDNCIKIFQDGSMSKEITKHFMLLLAQQRFPPKTMSQDRVSRLITALSTIDQKVKGKSIIQQRLLIYRTLVRQSRAHMILNTLWVGDLFGDMLSSLKDIRREAITFGLEAAHSLGMESSVSRAVVTLSKTKVPDVDKVFAEYYIDRLKTAIEKKEDASTVPQIWSVIMLFLRSHPQQLEKWQFFKPFLSVQGLCFNTADTATKTEAYHAWNRLIFAIQPNHKTSPSMRTTLFNAPSSLLKRKSTIGRKGGLSTIYTLLYYAFSPLSKPADLDVAWDEYLVPLIEDCLGLSKDNNAVPETAQQDAAIACRVLQCLFDPTPKKWSETRTMDNLLQNTVDVRELPMLDSKWLRANHARVFRLLRPLLQRLYWDLTEDSPATRLWKAYTKLIAAPAVTEVKVNIDTMSCIGSLFGTIVDLCSAGPTNLGLLSPNAPPNKSVAFWKGIETILTTAIDALGILAFTDRHLSIKHNNYVAVATPSSLPTKQRLETKSPLHHLITLLSNPSALLNFDKDSGFLSMAHSVLLPFFTSKKSKNARLTFIKEMTLLLTSESTPATVALWQTFADLVILAIEMREKDTNLSTDLPLGLDYRVAIGILETGIHLSPHLPLQGWKTAYDALIVSAALDAGESGKALVVIEPLAKAFRSRKSSTETTYMGLFYVSTLLGKATYPKDQQALDVAERKLWGAKSTFGKTVSFDPYSDLYSYVTYCLGSAYATYSKSSIADYADMITSVNGLLQRCPPSLVGSALVKMQNGIAIWIADKETKLLGGNALGLAIITLWQLICKLMPMLCSQRDNSSVLRESETLICAGLESKHKTIVNSTISMWNSSFGSCQDGLVYPNRAKDALIKLYSLVDIQLPSFPEHLDPGTSGSHRQATGSLQLADESSQYPVLSGLSQYVAPRPVPDLLRRSAPKVVVEKTTSLKRSRIGTPEAHGRSSKRRDVTPRLRHDDSQVQFEAVPSSSPMRNTDILTEKQREVRERQEAEAAMFSDFRSSSRSRNNNPESEDVEMELPTHRSSSKMREKFSQQDREITPNPVVPSDDDINFVQSSPTPTRVTRELVQDPPSSPPESASKHRSQFDGGISSSPPEGTPEPTASAPPTNLAPAIRDLSVDLDDTVMKDNFANTTGSSPREQSSDQEDTVMCLMPKETTEHTEPASDSPMHANANHDAIQVDDITMEEEGSVAFDHGKAPGPSLENSAQILSGALERRGMETYNISFEDRSSSPSEDPNDQLRASQLEYEAAQAAADARAQPPLVNDEGTQRTDSSNGDHGPRSSRLETPQAVLQLQAGVLAPLSSPRTPQFADAMSSSAESDRQYVFEDAVSSPRLNIARLKQPDSSSTLSEIDESSMLRVMAEYDQSSKKQAVLDNKETQPRRTRSSLRQTDESLSIESPTTFPGKRRSPRRKQSSPQKDVQSDKGDVEDISQPQISFPSLIAETPASSAFEPTKSTPQPVEQTATQPDNTEAVLPSVDRYFDDNGTELNMNDTIIVDASELEREDGLRVHQRSPRKKRGRKRSLALNSQDGLVAGSQEDSSNFGSPALEDDSQVSQATPVVKRGRGRPRKSMTPPAPVEGNLRASIEWPSSQMSASKSVTPIDLDTHMTETEIDAHSFAEGLAEKAPKEEEEEVVMDTIVEDTQVSSPDRVIIEETVLGESNSSIRRGSQEAGGVYHAIVSYINEQQARMDELLPGPSFVHTPTKECNISSFENGSWVELGDNANTDGSHSATTSAKKRRHLEDEQMEDGDVDSRMAGKVASEEEAEAEDSAESIKLLMQNVKAKLQTVNGISRKDVRELEDLFMDAKRLLYQAELRGRSPEDA